MLNNITIFREIRGNVENISEMKRHFLKTVRKFQRNNKPFFTR